MGGAKAGAGGVAQEGARVLGVTGALGRMAWPFSLLCPHISYGWSVFGM